MENREYCDSFCADDEKLELLICSDITMSYMNLCLYEDAYAFCDRALKEQLYYENVTEFFTVDLDRLYVELLYLKAMCLAHLSQFQEAIKILKQLRKNRSLNRHVKFEIDIDFVKLLQAQRGGDYKQILSEKPSPSQFEKYQLYDKVLNYDTQSLELKSNN